MSNSQSAAGGMLQPIRAAFLSFLCLISSTAAYADIQDIESANNQVAAQFQYAYMHYAEKANDNETGTGGTLDTEDGYIRGYGLSAALMQDAWLGHDYFAARYSSFSGQTSYIGGTQANPAYGSLAGESGATIKDGSLRYGTGFIMDHEFMITPYGELGRHKYFRTLVPGTPGSYQETYTHSYFGIGALTQYSPSDKVVYSLDALMGRTYGANIAVALPAPYTGFTARLGNSIVEKIGVSVDYALAKNLHLNAGIDVTSWSYGASASQAIGNGLYTYEPSSTTTITTAQAGVGFGF